MVSVAKLNHERRVASRQLFAGKSKAGRAKHGLRKAAILGF